MKSSLLFLLIILSARSLLSQDCYKNYLEQGINAYDDLLFQEAIDLFEAAKICPDIIVEQGDEVEGWLTKARNGYIAAIVKARDNAIRLEESAINA